MSAKFCTECGSALEAADRFCVSCGATVRAGAPVAAAAPAAPAAAAATMPAAPAVTPKKGGSFFTWEIRLGVIAGALSALATLATGAPASTAMVSGVSALVTVFVAVLILHILFKTKILLVLALLLILGTVASAAYVVAPDLPAIGLPSQSDLQRAVPFLRPAADGPARKPTAADLKASEARTARLLDEVRAGQRYLEQLRASGLPIVSAQVIPSSRGNVLHVGVSYERLASALSGTAGVAETFDAIVRVAQQRALDLTGIQDLTVAALDARGRALFSASAPAAAVERFRSGQIDRGAFLAQVGFKGESRLAIIDALRSVAGSLGR